MPPELEQSLTDPKAVIDMLITALDRIANRFGGWSETFDYGPEAGRYTHRIMVNRLDEPKDSAMEICGHTIHIVLEKREGQKKIETLKYDASIRETTPDGSVVQGGAGFDCQIIDKPIDPDASSCRLNFSSGDEEKTSLLFSWEKGRFVIYHTVPRDGRPVTHLTDEEAMIMFQKLGFI